MTPSVPITTYWKPSNAVRGSYSYKWETTGARGSTIFMKKTNEFINVAGEKPW
jgi:hypothetical protein